jgi:hypothetical protein
METILPELISIIFKDLDYCKTPLFETSRLFVVYMCTVPQCKKIKVYKGLPLAHLLCPQHETSILILFQKYLKNTSNKRLSFLDDKVTFLHDDQRILVKYINTSCITGTCCNGNGIRIVYPKRRICRRSLRFVLSD